MATATTPAAGVPREKESMREAHHDSRSARTTMRAARLGRAPLRGAAAAARMLREDDSIVSRKGVCGGFFKDGSVRGRAGCEGAGGVQGCAY